MNDSRLPFLMVPALEIGRGSGHLKRLLSLASDLRSIGKAAVIYIGITPRTRMVRRRLSSELKQTFSTEFEAGEFYEGDPAGRKWRAVILDRFRCPEAEYRYWRSLAPVIAIDEGADAVRRRADYLIDLLPRPASGASANRVDPGLLATGVKRRNTFFVERPVPKILVTFGGEDRQGLTRTITGILRNDSLLNENLDIHVISPAFFKSDESQKITARNPSPILNVPSGEDRSMLPNTSLAKARIVFIGRQPDLKELLADYDLVITQYGLTAFEALRAKVPVLLVAPTRYHQRLARHVGFASAGGRGGLERRLPIRLRDRAAIASASSAVAARFSESPATLADAISLIDFIDGGRCPLCRSAARSGNFNPVRFGDRSFFRCAACGMIYQVRTASPPISYSRRYFFEDYAAQYGRTYLEDFPHLEALAKRRLKNIARFLATAAPRFLDIGCAYGPALTAARKLGWSAYGLDPAADAIQFVRDTLNIPAAIGGFPAADPLSLFGAMPFDVVSLWYVIEHFNDLDEVMRNLNRCLRLDGVLALATPSASGISGRFGRCRFFERSPRDHWTVWEPGRTPRLLARYGFVVRKIIVTGHHPERFPFYGCRRSPAWFTGARDAILSTISRICGLGDTFEIYAVKIRDIGGTGS